MGSSLEKKCVCLFNKKVKVIKEDLSRFRSWSILPATGVYHLGLLVHGLTKVLELFLAGDDQLHLAGLHEEQAAGGGVLAKQKVEAHGKVPAAPGQPSHPTDQSNLSLETSAGGGRYQGPGAAGQGRLLEIHQGSTLQD